MFNILKFLSKPKNRTYENVILEASSHALDQERFKGIKFNTSGFTNLSRDHFDYHNNINKYQELNPIHLIDSTNRFSWSFHLIKSSN